MAVSQEESPSFPAAPKARERTSTAILASASGFSYAGGSDHSAAAEDDVSGNHGVRDYFFACKESNAPSFEDDMATGTVKWFNDEKGFGFITPDNGGPDLFAHHTEIQGTGFKSLAEGAKVEFEVTQGKKGPQASQIRKL